MSEITLKTITYKELRDNSYVIKDDRYGLASFLTDSVKKTILECPGNTDENKAVFVMLLDGDTVVGKEMRLGTRLKLDGEIITAGTGGGLLVQEEYRKTGDGINIMLYKEYDYSIGSLFTRMVVPMWRKMKHTVFELPQYEIYKDFGYILKSHGFHGALLRMATMIVNIPIKCINAVNEIRIRRLMKKCVVKPESVIPGWAGEMTMHDGSRFMEIHDTKWLQWNLDNNLNIGERDTQKYCSVYDKEGHPMGFFFIKERMENCGKYGEQLRGTIVEWASADEKVLCEADLMLLATKQFSADVKAIRTVTVNEKTAKCLKKHGFVRHGVLEFKFKFPKGQFPEAKDPSLWRLRYGSCNTIIY